jgi:ligand-binding sensor domain-containing protein
MDIALCPHIQKLLASTEGSYLPVLAAKMNGKLWLQCSDCCATAQSRDKRIIRLG